MNTFIFLTQSTTLIITLLISIATITLLERNLLGITQSRNGPNIINTSGIVQPIADALKLIINEIIIPNNTNHILFIITPIITLTLALFIWTIIPFNNNQPISDINISIIFIFAISSLSVYSILLTGWSSNSNYAFIGSIRATAQMISYEIAIGLIILTIITLTNSFNFNNIIELQENIWLIFPLFPIFTMFIISSLAETNRTPFDLTESESELVAGFNIEYTSINFTLLFISEYLFISLMSAITTIIFLGGSTIINISTPLIFSLNISIIIYIFIWFRTSFPRMRYDQLMNLIWNSLLPLSLSTIILIPTIYITLIQP